MQPPDFKLEAFFDEFEFVPDMNVLGSSDAQTLSLGELLGLSDKPLPLSDIPLSYQEVKGDDSLRAAVAEMYQPAKIGAENVLITTGASEAIFLALHALLNPGDRAVLCRPVFQSVYEVARMAGATISFYDYDERNDFRPDLSAIYQGLRGKPAPKLLFINTPHNPTGRAMDEATLKAVLVEAHNANVTVLANEMYAGVWLPPTKPIPSALAFDLGAIVIGGLSKVFGLAGLRIGWVIGPEEVVQTCKRLRYCTTLCPPAILQKLGRIAVLNREKILERNQQTVVTNYEAAVQWLTAHQEFFEWVKPDAGQVMLIRLKSEMDTELFARELATKAEILLIPCTSCFDMAHGYLRLGLGADPTRFSQGLSRLSDFLRNVLHT